MVCRAFRSECVYMCEVGSGVVFMSETFKEGHFMIFTFCIPGSPVCFWKVSLINSAFTKERVSQDWEIFFCADTRGI